MRFADRLRRTRRLLPICWLLLTPGCGEVWGPERFTTTTVRGRLFWRGEAVAGGWLEFVPVLGTTGVLRSAEVDRDGSFRVTGIPVGTVGIRLIGSPASRSAGDPDRDRFFHEISQSYAISRTITGTTSSLTIDLADEASRRQAP